jgi:crossover junction endodeoxyribonuclease RuvC
MNVGNQTQSFADAIIVIRRVVNGDIDGDHVVINCCGAERGDRNGVRSGRGMTRTPQVKQGHTYMGTRAFLASQILFRYESRHSRRLSINVERVFVLGIDPGVTRCGYGLVTRGARRPEVITAGVLTTPPADALPLRLATLWTDLKELMDEFTPDVVVVERVFFQTNVRTAMSVGQASGLALALASAAGCDVVQYTANEVKQAVTGDGAAPKLQVQRMVQTLLGLPEMPSPPDVADALALALCHHSQASWHSRVGASS